MTAAGPGFDAAVFDLDGLLVDSETLWHQAEIEVLGFLGVPIDAQRCRQTKGMFVGDVTRYWYARAPWSGPDPDEVAEQVVDTVMDLVVTRGRLLPGVDGALSCCGDRGWPLAVASSSPTRLVDLELEHFGLAEQFVVVHSAQDEPAGKPHPAVYLGAAARLGARPEHCLAFEDAPAGVLAAKAARMACVAVPDPAERDAPAFAIADAVLGSLAEVDDRLLDRLVAAHAADPLAAPSG